MTELQNAPYVPVMVIALLSICLVFLFRLGWPARGLGATPFKAKKLLTGNETEFLHRLRRALPNLEVIPQVSMGALLDLTITEAHPDYWAWRQTFAMKIIDYVVCEGKGLNVVAVVELDDCTHDCKQAKDSQRDAMLLSAGIVTLRWDSRCKPSEAAIAAQFRGLVPQNKPKPL